jgi:HPt (histidine-containing phosphotransfer) domain-containing protein
MADPPLDGAFLDLQREYLASMPERLEELRSDLAAMNGGAVEAAGSLKARLHRLAGSGGSFGFLDISVIAREAEQCLADNPAVQSTGLAPIFDRLEDAIRRAEARLVALRADKPAP